MAGGVTQSNGAKLSLISLQQMWLLVLYPCCLSCVAWREFFLSAVRVCSLVPLGLVRLLRWASRDKRPLVSLGQIGCCCCLRPHFCGGTSLHPSFYFRSLQTHTHSWCSDQIVIRSLLDFDHAEPTLVVLSPSSYPPHGFRNGIRIISCFNNLWNYTCKTTYTEQECRL